MSSTISQALANIGHPVSYVPYTGNAQTYITYQLLGQSGVLYAEGAEKETAVRYAVDIFSPGFASVLILNTKTALEAAGYIVTIDMETYDHETDRHQAALIAEIEGAVYG